MVVAGAGVAVLAGCALFVAWAFGCASHDAIPDCDNEPELAAWWGLPSAALLLSVGGSFLAWRDAARSVRAVLVVAAAAACLVGWYLGVLRP